MRFFSRNFALMLATAVSGSIGLVSPALSATNTSLERVYIGSQLCNGNAGGCSTPIFADSVLSYNNPAQIFSGVTSYGFVGASGYADLSNSAVHATFVAFSLDEKNYTYAMAGVAMGDTFSIRNSDGSVYSGNGTSRFSLDIEGSAFASNASFDLSVNVGVYKTGYFDSFRANDIEGMSNKFIGMQGIRFSDTSEGELPQSIQFDFATPSESFEWQVQIFGWTSFNGVGSVNVDLGNTVNVSFGSPVGTNVLSASGYLPASIAAPVGNVPEPETYAMLLAGLGLLGAVARRKRK